MTPLFRQVDPKGATQPNRRCFQVTVGMSFSLLGSGWTFFWFTCAFDYMSNCFVASHLLPVSGKLCAARCAWITRRTRILVLTVRAISGVETLCLDDLIPSNAVCRSLRYRCNVLSHAYTQVKSVRWSDAPRLVPHEITLYALQDGRKEREDLPLSPWN